MNIRKNIDYGEMYAALDYAMAAEMEQMELYCAIGRAVSLRPEKGAAVAAAKYLTERYPDVHGFSPRNVRRMRDFFRAYENHPALLTLALQIGWTQNVVILEADLSMELCEWYLRAAKQFGWSKMELAESIANNAHEKIVLAIENNLYDSVERENKVGAKNVHKVFGILKKIQHLIQRHKSVHRLKEGKKRRWTIMEVELLDLIEEDNKVAIRARFTGTHSGDLCDVKATGKRISFEALEIFRLEDGKIVESWGYWPDYQIRNSLITAD